MHCYSYYTPLLGCVNNQILAHAAEDDGGGATHTINSLFTYSRVQLCFFFSADVHLLTVELVVCWQSHWSPFNFHSMELQSVRDKDK